MNSEVMSDKKITLSIVIPVADDSRNAYLEQLLKSLDEQTFQNFEVILVVGDRRQGRAINNGVAQAHGEWIMTMDDDTQIEDPELLKKLVDEMTKDPSIGLGGAACIIPDWATPFQKKAMKEIPRRYFPIQKETVDSDFVQHPCLIIAKDLFMQIGREDEELIRGLDPVLRQKVRDAGKRVCVIKDTAVIHLLPDGFRRIISMYRRNGRGSAFAYKFFKDRVLELTTGYDQGEFVRKRPMWFRINRRFYNILRNFVRANWIRQSADLAYIWGWVEGWLIGEFPEGKSVVSCEEDETYESKHAYTIRRLQVKEKMQAIEEQIARMHILSERDFMLGSQEHPQLNFYRDKVGVFRNYSPEGFLFETNEEGEVLGFLLMLLDQADFKKQLVKNGYGLRYIVSLLTGRYRMNPQDWKKFFRLPFAFIKKPPNHSSSGNVKIVAFLVREDLRSQGVGARLLKRAEQLAFTFDRHHIEVTVLKSNEGAMRFYQKYGYLKSGEFTESIGECWYLDKSIGVP